MVSHVLRTQLAVLAAMTAAGSAFGAATGVLVLLGGLVAFVANGYFAQRVLGGSGAKPGDRPPQAHWVGLMWAESVKVGAAAVLLAVAYWATGVLGAAGAGDALGMTCGFLVVYASGLIAVARASPAPVLGDRGQTARRP